MGKITALSADTSPSSEDLILTVDNPGGTPTNKKVTIGNLFANAPPIAIAGTLGVERVTNGGFDADTNWTKGANWAIAAGIATHTAGSIETLSQDLTEVLGEVYKIVYTISGRTAGTIRVRIQGQLGLLRSTNETFTEYITGTDDNVAASRNLHFIPSSTFDGSIDNISVKVVTSGTLTIDGEATFRSPVRLDADIFLKHGGIITKGDPGYGKPNLVCINQNDEVAAFFVGGGLWTNAALYITGSMSATIDDNGYFNVLDYGIHADDASDGGMIYVKSDIDGPSYFSRLNATANAIHFRGKDSNSKHNIDIGPNYIYWYGTNLWTDASNYEGGYLTHVTGAVTLGARTLGSGADNVDINLTPVGTGNVNITSGELEVAGTQVVGARVVDARCDDTINSGDATTDGVIDSLRDAMIAHGLIAAA